MSVACLTPVDARVETVVWCLTEHEPGRGQGHRLALRYR